MKYLLLDTNIYLHYRDFEQIDWKTLAGDPEIAIVVPDTVIREIDKHKDGIRGKIKSRAKSVAAKFAGYFLDDSCERKLNVIQIDDPSDSVLAENGLNRSVCDDVIIGAALAFDHKEDLIVISHDNTLLIKAKKFGLSYLLKIPQEYLISEEKSDEEKELEKCRKELMMLKSRSPEPKITFTDGATTLRIKAPADSDIDSTLAEKMAEIRSAHPYAVRPAMKSDKPVGIEALMGGLSSLSNMRYWGYTPEQLEEYNRELDKYYAYCERFYRFKLEKQQLEKQLRELSFVVVNTGNAETGTMEIFFNFPVGVRIYDKRCVKQINNIEPDAPMIGSVFSEFNSLNMMHYLSPEGGLNVPQLYCWDLTKCLSKQKIALTSQSLVHNVQRALKFKYPLYIDTAQCGSFTINWQICAAGSPAPIKGVLNVVIESD